jgi:hypothetical protein
MRLPRFSYSLPFRRRLQEKPLRVEVLRSSEGSLYANSTLIVGDKDAVLVDPPWMPIGLPRWCSKAASA